MGRNTRTRSNMRKDYYHEPVTRDEDAKAREALSEAGIWYAPPHLPPLRIVEAAMLSDPKMRIPMTGIALVGKFEMPTPCTHHEMVFHFVSRVTSVPIVIIKSRQRDKAAV